jgi:hypothetical protein
MATRIVRYWQVYLTVGNNPPTATPDIFTVNRDTQLTINFPSLLANDGDPDGDSLTVSGYDRTTTNMVRTIVAPPEGSSTLRHRDSSATISSRIPCPTGQHRPG